MIFAKIKKFYRIYRDYIILFFVGLFGLYLLLSKRGESLKRYFSFLEGKKEELLKKREDLELKEAKVRLAKSKIESEKEKSEEIYEKQLAKERAHFKNNSDKIIEESKKINAMSTDEIAKKLNQNEIDRI